MRKYLLNIFVSFGAFVLLLSLGFSLYQDWQNLQLEITQKSAELDSRRRYFENLKEAQANLAKFPDEVAKIQAALPLEANLASVLDFLQKTASQQALVLKKVGLGEQALVADDPPIKKQLLYLELSGDYSALKEFIGLLENSSRLIKVESLSFSLPDQGEIFLFNLVLSVNFLSTTKF